MELNQIEKILQDNKTKNFISRIVDPSQKLQNEDGSVSTHSMSYGEADGKFFVFPTVIDDGSGELKRLSGDDAWGNAMEKGEFVEFDNEQDASEFSMEYKKYWDRVNSTWN